MLKAIKSKIEYNKAVQRIYDLMQKELKANSREANELEVLSILVEKYEEEHFPIDPPDPIEAIKFRMEQMGLTRSDLAKYIGYKSRVTEILNRKRKLTLPMIKRLHKGLKIPVESLIGI